MNVKQAMRRAQETGRWVLRHAGLADPEKTEEIAV